MDLCVATINERMWSSVARSATVRGASLSPTIYTELSVYSATQQVYNKAFTFVRLIRFSLVVKEAL